jgi:hypothetical protein
MKVDYYKYFVGYITISVLLFIFSFIVSTITNITQAISTLFWPLAMLVIGMHIMLGVGPTVLGWVFNIITAIQYSDIVKFVDLVSFITPWAGIAYRNSITK